MSKVDEAEVSLVIPRNTWQSGTVYDEYWKIDSDEEIPSVHTNVNIISNI